MSLTISVVIPTYNRAKLVVRAVASALANVEPGDEVIVIDDDSTDDTAARLASFGDRIRLLQGKHAGAGAARNIGIAAARGDIVAFLDSDDEWMPNKLALQRALFQARPDILFCFSDFAVRTTEGREIRHYLPSWHRLATRGRRFVRGSSPSANHPRSNVGGVSFNLLAGVIGGDWRIFVKRRSRLKLDRCEGSVATQVASSAPVE